MGLGIGLAVNNSRAVLTGAVRRGGVFHRTPKYRVEEGVVLAEGNKYRLRKNQSFYMEAGLALYLALCCLLAVGLKMWFALPFLLLFLHGYSYIFLLGLVPNLGHRPPRLPAADPSGSSPA
jgi:hypothetical protein